MNQCFADKYLTALQKKKEDLICIICGFLWYKYTYLANFNLRDTEHSGGDINSRPSWALVSRDLHTTAGTELGNVSMWC